MKEILFATGNVSKVNELKSQLLKKGISMKYLKDFDMNLDVEENGKTAIENAIIKAKAYHEMTGMITMAKDDTLFIENIPESKQPGIYVRRVNGKRLNDKEMIEYYTNLVKEYGTNGILETKWILGVVVIKDGKVYTCEEITDDYCLVDTPAPDINEGYPLSSIMFNKKAQKYDVYMNEEDKEKYTVDHTKFVEFISKVLCDDNK